MNPLKYLFFFFCFALIVACGNDDASSARQAPINNQAAPTPPPVTAPAPATTSTPAPTAATTPPPPPAEPAQNAAGVWHYTCGNGCAGGAGSATACATCGSTLAHNQGYHGQSTTTPTAGAPVQVGGGTPSTMFADPSQPAVNATVGAAPAPIQTAEPAQNAAGVWHYTCGNGCSGGAGSAVACSQCGSTLAHNQGYH